MSLGFLISDALAQTAQTGSAVVDTAANAAATGTTPPSNLQEAMMRFFPWFAILAVFYFLLIRPQNKKYEEHKKLVEGLRRGDKVVTIGGIIGTLSSVEDAEVIMEVEGGMKLRVQKSAVSAVSAKTEPAATK